MKGATVIFPNRFALSDVSIHAPVKGATTTNTNLTYRWSGFNPRTREGCDVSGAIECASIISFNPRTREGCDSTQMIVLEYIINSSILRNESIISFLIFFDLR